MSIDDNGDINVEEEDSDPEFTMDDDEETSVIESEPSSQSVEIKITHIVIPNLLLKEEKLLRKRKRSIFVMFVNSHLYKKAA